MNMSSERITSVIKDKITPASSLKFVVFIALWFYHDIVTNPSARSINTYYNEYYPFIGNLIDVFLPILFIIGIGLLIAFSKTYPFRVILLASIPQFLYTALSAGWYFGLYPTINRAALYIHLVVSLFIVLIAWLGVYDDSHDISTD